VAEVSEIDQGQNLRNLRKTLDSKEAETAEDSEEPSSGLQYYKDCKPRSVKELEREPSRDKEPRTQNPKLKSYNSSHCNSGYGCSKYGQ
jgi:hypothetical protein